MQAMEHFRALVPADEKREHFCALHLNVRGKLLHEAVVSIGTLTASLVHPREVFAKAIELRAAAVIIGHNHPSGDADPSPEDKLTTKRLQKAGEILGITVLDHIIFTDTAYFSFRDKGMI